MNDQFQRGRRAAHAGLVLVVCAAAAVLAGAVLAVLDRRVPPSPFADVVAPRSVDAAEGGQIAAAFEAQPQRIVTALVSTAPARPAERTTDAAPPPAIEVESDRSALLVPAARAAKPGRHEAIATRLGWAPGDARTQLLATWLSAAHGRSEADLVACFGAADAAAIARDLAPAVVEDR